MKTNSKQLIAILSTGITIIILMLVFENIGIGSMANIGQEKGNSFQELQADIDKIPNNQMDPSVYATISAKIHTSKANGFITADVETDLQKKLDLYYVNKVVETTERYLHSANGDFNKILKTLVQLQNISTLNNEDKLKIRDFVNVMNTFKYYTEVLPQEVSGFIMTSNFNPNQFDLLIGKINNPSNLLLPYLNNPKIQSVKRLSEEGSPLLRFQVENLFP